jgi:hypothetical protein
MAEEKKSSGTHRAEILAAELRLAASLNTDPCVAFVETAKKIVAEFPDMSPAEKQVHYGALRHQIEMNNIRTHQDCSNVLGSVAKILGVSAN